MQFSIDILKKCWFLAGPTACGKSELALVLAESIQAEIVSLDSMALYRGMDIGTAKPVPEDRERIPHHLIDIIDPHEEFSLAEYVESAEKACREILSRNRTPLFVGGTGLYLRGILRGVFDGPPADWEYRRTLEEEAGQQQAGYLHQKLQGVDPRSAEKLHPNDVRRQVRALEVYHLTGTPLSEQQRQSPLPPDERPRQVFWLSPPRKWLYQRVNHRVDRMLEAGLVDEVKQLLTAEQPMSRTARQALGYKEVVEHLNGEIEYDAMVTRIKTRTRQFAKRQHTWFRNLDECAALEITGSESPRELAETIMDRTRVPGQSGLKSN